MERNKLAAPCGLYCGVCGVYIAHKENNLKFKERLAPVFGVSVDEIRCEGCFSDVKFVRCQTCRMKACVISKNYEGCYQCHDFPCRFADEFRIPIAKKVSLRSVPEWRQLGNTEKWIEAEEKRYHCPQCGYKLFRGVKKCRNCNAAVDVD